MTTAEQDTDYVKRLLHRWLVQFNPLYLLSAALVLAGTILISRGLAKESTAFGQVGVAAIAELYPLALIGGAAFLTRIGQRRPGVMLALLAVLYQCDLTLHTETCAYLGNVAALAAIAWFLLFVGKLYAIAWAVKIRLSVSATAVPLLAAAGFAFFPHLIRSFEGTTPFKAVAFWVFAMGAMGLWTTRSITSRVPLDDWGNTVLRRASRATWALWTLLACGHLLFWSVEFQLQLLLLLPVAALLSTRWIRSELRLWLLVTLTMVLTGLACPTMFSSTAVMAAIVLVIRAFRHPVVVFPSASSPETGPYRRPLNEAEPKPTVAFDRAPKPLLVRLLTGAILALYLAVWTAGWADGAWPDHILVLDLLLSLTAFFAVWKGKSRIALLPLGGIYLHLLVTRHWVTAPQTTLGWGIACAVAGFVMLLGSLVTSWRLKKFVQDSEAQM